MINFYLLALVFMLMHEMDAIRCKEWRIFPGLSILNDRLGLIIFMAAHIPLFYWIMNEVQANNESFRVGFDYFAIIHFILHLIFLLHPKNEFKDYISWIIITGAAVFGTLDLMIKWELLFTYK